MQLELQSAFCGFRALARRKAFSEVHSHVSSIMLRSESCKDPWSQVRRRAQHPTTSVTAQLVFLVLLLVRQRYRRMISPNLQVQDLYGDARYRTLGIQPTATAADIRQASIHHVRRFCVVVFDGGAHKLMAKPLRVLLTAGLQKTYQTSAP